MTIKCKEIMSTMCKLIPQTYVCRTVVRQRKLVDGRSGHGGGRPITGRGKKNGGSITGDTKKNGA